MIGNGGRFFCKGKYCNVKLNMDDYHMKSDMYVTPLGGYDVELGFQWLHTLGPILWDFLELWMKFTFEEHTYHLIRLHVGPS